ncbi:MAG: amidohydrolase, partial [Acidimicrobiia bacterium]|nr:amidohydrolase [Acidimicrobiia bacterium]
MDTAPISADSHIVEPPGCYVDHIDARWRDVAPRVEKNAKGVDAYVIDGLANPIPIELLAAAGIPPERLGEARRHSFDQMNPAAFDPHARLGIQDEEGIGGELIFASIGMVLCAHRDYAYKTAAMTAYNRWLAGFCAEHPDRLFGLAQSAVESVDQTIADMELAKQLGLVGMMMTGTPQHEDYDHPDYDAVWQAAVDLDLPLCFHILTSNDYDVASTFRPPRGHMANGFMNIIRGVQDIMGVFVFGGVFERFPGLRMVVAEGDAGWVPHWCYRADHFAGRMSLGLETLSKTPSQYVMD